MSRTRDPWMKWYPADWRADPMLRMCSFAARGLWADMIALMHEAEPYGHLVIAGVNPTPRQLASVLGGTEREVAKLLAELEAAGVFSKEADGTIYSRRMVRDRVRSEEGRANVAKRADRSPPTEKPLSPPSRVSTTQKLEARSQKLDSTPQPPIGGLAAVQPMVVLETTDSRKVDELRRRIWRHGGATEDQIATKLATANREGLAQVNRWVQSIPLDDLPALVDSMIAGARSQVSRPWVYLDSAIASEIERRNAEAQRYQPGPNGEAPLTDADLRLVGAIDALLTTGTWNDQLPVPLGRDWPAAVSAKVGTERMGQAAVAWQRWVDGKPEGRRAFYLREKGIVAVAATALASHVEEPSTPPIVAPEGDDPLAIPGFLRREKVGAA